MQIFSLLDSQVQRFEMGGARMDSYRSESSSSAFRASKACSISLRRAIILDCSAPRQEGISCVCASPMALRSYRYVKRRSCSESSRIVMLIGDASLAPLSYIKPKKPSRQASSISLVHVSPATPAPRRSRLVSALRSPQHCPLSHQVCYPARGTRRCARPLA